MIDIEERLRRDAAAWQRDDHAPSFERALDLVTIRRPRRRGVWLAAAAVVAVGAVVTAVLAWPTSTHRSAGHPSNGTITKRVAHVAAVAVLISASDPRMIMITYEDDGGPLCGSIANRVASLSVSSSAIRVSLSGYTEIQYGDGKVVGHGCTAAHYDWLGVPLAAPLGNRPVYDGQSTTPLPVLDPAALHTPGYLPPGFRLRATSRIDEVLSELSFFRTYVRGRANGLIIISVAVTGTATLPPVATHGPIDVNGHGATYDTDGDKCLRWSIGRRIAESVCNGGRVSTPELLKVARSLH